MKAKRLINGIKSIDKLAIGAYNFENGINDLMARKIHLKACNEMCEHFEDEQVEWLKTDDDAVPGLSGKTCSECWCILSYKLRVEGEKCPLGKW